ncbi:RHS repeat-associated core domain-containing protein, partial [Salmonella enterica subsp. enterica]|nr:RHS repeat-associated core domain-containing protein [Salmonella enterica subsp. enterica]EEK5411740.1 RHS repeat-associated core domain-containing protein [Salmonella enterica subsp. enterica serovar Tudu]EHB7348320.1 RHS repeat-associated core domain-containing protein [Salmonella enterica subsp. enterica serovar Bracknell]EHX6233974.1 RHS repeat-associated core domain-containing protein [Salmonella enterica subsp. enterica serovar Agbeni]ELP2333990.1 RHS repeat-associated core domain-cont
MAFLTPVRRLRGSVVYSYDRSGYLTGRSGQMYDHDRYY